MKPENPARIDPTDGAIDGAIEDASDDDDKRDDNDALTLIVRERDDVGERADVVLGRRLPEVSRRIARRLALEGHLQIDGHKARPSARVELGNQLTLRLRRGSPASAATVLECTEHFVYALKPRGMHTHRLRPDGDSTLADAVALLHPECRRASPDPRQGGAVHRLDRDTTGIVAFARTLDAWRAARQSFAERRVLKIYRAQTSPGPWPPTAAGTTATEEPPPEGPWPTPTDPGVVIDRPLGPAGRRRVVPRPEGRPAITVVWSLPAETHSGTQLVLRLVTGHRHQARAHLAWVDRPIVGDSLYGGADHGVLRLHAAVLDLSGTGLPEPRIVAPVPPGWA